MRDYNETEWRLALFLAFFMDTNRLSNLHFVSFSFHTRSFPFAGREWKGKVVEEARITWEMKRFLSFVAAFSSRYPSRSPMVIRLRENIRCLFFHQPFSLAAIFFHNLISGWPFHLSFFPARKGWAVNKKMEREVILTNGSGSSFKTLSARPAGRN